MSRLFLLLLYPLLLLGLAITAVRFLTCMIGNPGKAWHIALMIDQTVNVDANGRVDQSISQRAALAMRANRQWGCILCWVLDHIQKDHCANSLKP
jgi:hypothetical protein